MITGMVTVHREALIPLSVQDANGQEHTIDAVIDTGYTGGLTLPPALVAALGLTWRGYASAVLGDGSLSDYTVSASVTLDATSHSAGLIARFSHPKTDGGGLGFNGYQFIVHGDGTCGLFLERVGMAPVALGTCSPSSVTSSFDLSLSVHGSILIGSVNGSQVVSVTDSTLGTGIAGISTGGWYPVQFSNLQLTS